MESSAARDIILKDVFNNECTLLRRVPSVRDDRREWFNVDSFERIMVIGIQRAYKNTYNK